MQSHSTHRAVEVVARGTVFDHIGVNLMKGDETYPFAIAPNAVVTPRGGVLVAWTAGAYEVAPNAVTMGRETYDGGKTWTYEPFVIADRPDHGLINVAFIRDRQRMLVFYNDYLGRVKASHGWFIDGTEDVWLAESHDTGYYWSDPRQLTDFHQKRQPYMLQIRENGLRLAGGELVLPVGYHTRHFPPAKPEEFRNGFGVLRSDDDGKTWQRCLLETNDPNRLFDEPAIAQCADGSLLMYLRTNTGTMWQSRSHDGGRTWAQPADTGIVAAPASVALAKLPDGRFVLAWNDHPAKRTFLSVAVSSDEGKTWTGPDVIDMVCIQPMPPMQHEQAANVALMVDDEGLVWMVWAHIAWYGEGAYGSIKYARLKVRD